MHKLEMLSALLQTAIGVKRYEHTLCVVECALNLAQVYKIDAQQAKMAALFHDCGREIALEDGISYARKYGLKINKTESLQPVLLHAKIGRLIAEKKYLITDKSILRAIKYHTTGNKDMDSLAMLVYIADMLAAGRNFAGVDRLRSLVGKVDLHELMLYCLRSTLEHLLSEGLLVDIDSIKTYNMLLAWVKNKNTQSSEVLAYEK